MATSPITSLRAPIPFPLSPTVGPVSPLTAAQCASSPDTNRYAAHTEDSFSQAFTSIRATDESDTSSHLHILETICQSDSAQSLQSKSLADLSHNMSQGSEPLVSLNSTGITASDATSPSIMSETDMSEKPSFSDEKENQVNKPTQHSIQMRTPDQKLRKLTSSTREKRSKRTRFQSIVRSYSVNFDERVTQKIAGEWPGE